VHITPDYGITYSYCTQRKWTTHFKGNNILLIQT